MRDTRTCAPARTHGEVTSRRSCDGFDTRLELEFRIWDAYIVPRSVGNVCTYVGACVYVLKSVCDKNTQTLGWLGVC